jgi:hypothetical protein
MGSTVIVNNLTVVHKDSGGLAAAFPDACKTPSPAGPVPIPYPNMAQSSDAGDATSTVTADGKPVMVESSSFSTSTGDEAGSAQGVVSNKTKGKALPKMYSMDVKFDGKAVFRLTDIMLQNAGASPNTPPAAEVQAPAMAMATAGDPEKIKVTQIAWNKTEGCCGDPVFLRVSAENADGLAFPLLAYPTHKKDLLLDTLVAKIDGGRARAAWISRRGPYVKKVKAKARQEVLGGVAESSNELELKAPENAKDTVIGDRSTPKYKKHPVTHQLVPSGGFYGWPFGYDIELHPGELVITRKVDFVVMPGASANSRKKRRWKREIQDIWDQKFKLHRSKCQRKDDCDCAEKNGCCTWVVRVKCVWSGGHGKPVTLHAGGNSPNWGDPDWWYSHDWWEQGVNVPSTVRAHEFGHLFGQYDEYPLGACDPLRRFTNIPSSIMSAGTQVGKRHFEEYVKWFKSKAESVVGQTVLKRI